MIKNNSTDVFLSFIFMDDQIAPAMIDALESCENFEVILVAGGTIPKSLKKCRFSVSYANTLQKAINLAKGQYLYFPKYDEIIYPNMVAVCEKNASVALPDMLGFHAQYFNKDGILYHQDKFSGMSFDVTAKALSESYIANQLFVLNKMPFVYKTDFLRQQKFLFDVRFGYKMYDMIWLKALVNAHNIVALDEVLATQKYATELCSNTPEKLSQAVYFWEFAQDIIMHRDRQLWRICQVDFYDAQLNELYHIVLNSGALQRKTCTTLCRRHFEKYPISDDVLSDQQKPLLSFLTQERKSVLVSVIVQVTGNVQCLEQCINTLKEQTLSDFEVIFVNVNACVGVSSLLEKLHKSDSRFYVCDGKNQTVQSAFKQATGEYVCVVCENDFFDADWLFNSCEKAYRTHSDLVLVGYGQWNATFQACVAQSHIDENKEKFTLAEASNPAAVLDTPLFAMMVRRTLIFNDKNKYTSVGTGALYCARAENITALKQVLIYHQDKEYENDTAVFAVMDDVWQQLPDTPNWNKTESALTTYKWRTFIDVVAQQMAVSNNKKGYEEVKKRIQNISPREYEIVSQDYALMRQLKQMQTFSYLQLKYFISDFAPKGILKQYTRKSVGQNVKKILLFLVLLPKFVMQAHAMVKEQMHVADNGTNK